MSASSFTMNMVKIQNFYCQGEKAENEMVKGCIYRTLWFKVFYNFFLFIFLNVCVLFPTHKHTPMAESKVCWSDQWKWFGIQLSVSICGHNPNIFSCVQTCNLLLKLRVWINSLVFTVSQLSSSKIQQEKTLLCVVCEVSTVSVTVVPNYPFECEMLGQK